MTIEVNRTAGVGVCQAVDQQEEGYTALHAAALHGDDVMVRLLLGHGADPGVRDDEGRTAADHATGAGHTALAELLTPAAG